MDHCTTTISEVLRDRAERGMADLLLTVFDAGVAMGMGIPREGPDDAGTAALLDQIRDRWFTEIEARREWRRSETPDLVPEMIPAWLLAHAERQVLERKETP